ncbi:exported protein of unknown function [Nitrosotalea devaniterrae]|uniref:Uncharacterized protein n=1 Tax=Nitrosotalea devaniterrae TaxID=1078905 RepID=A0A128A4J4_9ARCH|nr:exported protein of unknown function [Candidatus Nitrosotalea devanaterra]
MIRDYAVITLGVLTLLATSGAVYGILTINTQIQAKPEQVKIPDYTAELDSLKSQVDSINSQIGTMSTSLATLDTLKTNVADISGKLSDLQAKADAVPQPVQTPTAPSVSLAIVLDKSSYLQTDTIKITAIGANPQKTVDIELIDSTGFVVLHKTTWSDSSGKISYDMQLSSALPVGNYQVQIISDAQTSTQPITITQSSTVPTTTSGIFTAQTDKSVYNTGDFIQVLGAGQAGTSITGVLTSPTGKTYSTATTIQSDGSFVMFFSPSQPYETGTWSILVTNLGQTKSLTIYVGTSSSGSYAFTAQTDKAVYNKGNLVQVSGTGQPNTSVSAVFTSQSGQTHTTTTTSNSDGTYSLFFSISTSYETGNWLVSVSNLSQSKTLSIYIQS